MKNFSTILIVLLMVSCGAPQAVYDYDESVDHSRFQTYAFYPELDSGLSPLDQDRLVASLESGMEKKGINASRQPVLLLNFYVEEYQKPSRNNMGVGIGGGGGNLGVGVSGNIPLGGPKNFLRLTFDLVDAKNDELIWQAVVDSKFDRNASPEKRRARFDRIVQKALEGYPPKG